MSRQLLVISNGPNNWPTIRPKEQLIESRAHNQKLHQNAGEDTAFYFCWRTSIKIAFNFNPDFYCWERTTCHTSNSAKIHDKIRKTSTTKMSATTRTLQMFVQVLYCIHILISEPPLQLPSRLSILQIGERQLVNWREATGKSERQLGNWREATRKSERGDTTWREATCKLERGNS